MFSPDFTPGPITRLLTPETVSIAFERGEVILGTTELIIEESMLSALML